MKNHFEQVQRQYVDLLDIEIQRYVHTRTKSNHYHFACEDNNKVFMVALYTPPNDSTGIAHILEHLVLCGSEKYPVRDPFFLMLRRSLSNFMNAFTASDWTAYPFATQYQKDFDNLLEVYLDAVFFPKLDRLDFMQEGWRVDYEKSTENTTPDLCYKGVVFNEMKGAMGSPARQLWHHLCRHIFPDSIYRHNSGGEPLVIPNLSHQEIVNFHRRFYHPNNSTFFSYGKQDPIRLQQQLETLVLSRFDDSSSDHPYNHQVRLGSPISVVASYPVEKSTSKDSHIIVAFLMGNSHEIDTLLEAHLLQLLLFDNSSSLLRKTLESSTFGEAPSPLCGLEDELHEMVMVAGLEGCEKDSAEAVTELIMNTLKLMVEEGVSKEQIQGCMHQLELSQREISSGSMPYGLDLLLSVTSAAVQGNSIFELVDIDVALKALNEKVNQNGYIEQLVQSMIENRHRVTLTMTGDDSLTEQQLLAEKTQLLLRAKQLGEVERKQIIEENEKLEERQLATPDVDQLPRVLSSDIKIEGKLEAPVASDESSVSAYTTRTNGLVHIQALTQLIDIDADTFRQIPLLSALLSEVGSGSQTYESVQRQISSFSGGLSVNSQLWQPLVHGTKSDQNMHIQLIFGIKGLASNSKKLFEILSRQIQSPVFSEHNHIRDMVSQWALSAKKSIPSNGHVLAMQAASSALSGKSMATALWSGLSGIKHLLEQSRKMGDQKQLLIFCDQLKTLYDHICRVGYFEWLLISDKSGYDQLMEAWNGSETLIKNNKPPSDTICCEASGLTNSAWSIEGRVNYCARAYQAVGVTHSDSAVFFVLANYLRNHYLHGAIRERGGAYGGGCNYDLCSETFRFFSYRDPRLEATFDDFSESLAQGLKIGVSDRELEEAILNAVSKINAPLSPVATVERDYFAVREGIDQAFKEQRIRNILQVKQEDLIRVMEQYFMNQGFSDAVITNSKKAEKLSLEGRFTHCQIEE